MSEPGPDLPRSSGEAENPLLQTLRHEFPQAQLERIGDAWVVYTVHGVGVSEVEALQNASKELRRMQDDGRSLPQILDDVREDLDSQPGMSRARHQSLTELLAIASNCLNDGTLTRTIPWIMIPGYTRQITDLQRRVDMRLAMKAKDMADREKALRTAKEKPEPRHAEYNPETGVRPASTLSYAFSLLRR